MVEDVYEKVKDVLHSVWHREMSADEGMDELTDIVDLSTRWQDISTAPKDGSVILVYDPDELFPFAARWNEYFDGWVDAIDADVLVCPAKWTYLPTL